MSSHGRRVVQATVYLCSCTLWEALCLVLPGPSCYCVSLVAQLSLVAHDSCKACSRLGFAQHKYVHVAPQARFIYTKRPGEGENSHNTVRTHTHTALVPHKQGSTSLLLAKHWGVLCAGRMTLGMQRCTNYWGTPGSAVGTMAFHEMHSRQPDHARCSATVPVMV